MRRINILVALILTITTMTAQQRLFTLEDLNFGGTNYRQMLPQNMWLTWWGQRLVQTDVEECYTINTKTGKKTLLFTLDDINRWAGNSHDQQVRHLSNATFPYPDKTIVALQAGKAFVLIDFKKKQTVWQDTLATSDANDWNARSRATAYVSDNQLCVADANGKEHRLTTDGSREIVYAQAVHRNEFGINKGTFWSPDGQLLAFYRMDQTMVADYPQVDVYQRQATYEPDKYPMAGMKTHRVTIGVYHLNTGKTIYLHTPKPTEEAESPENSLCTTPVYFTNIAWSPDSRTIYVQELNRAQNDCRLVSYDAATGQRQEELVRETSEKYVEPLHPIQFLPWDSNTFVMQSQRDGYNHLYLYRKDGTLLKQLTSGNWVVMNLIGFAKKTKTIIIASNEKNPLQRNIYAVDTETGRRTPLDNQQGVHHATLSEDGDLLYDKSSAPDTPRNIDITATDTSKPQTLRLLTAADPWREYLQPHFETGTLKAADGETDLFWRMVKPTDFSPQKKYPTVIYVYGGPHAHNVDASWHWASRSWETYMAQRGYIVFILDNRGSENRGRDFEQATFHQLGQIEMQDQMKGVDFLRTLPYVDMERLGVHGWSFGGFMTISLMTSHPDVFKVGVAGGPVIDWSLYEVMYGERYMGTPQTNPEGYEKTSLISKAPQLKGRLQIITGYNDNTVVPQHCLRFIDACVKAGAQPDFFAYPGEEHNMRGHASVHLHERITRYFDDYLK